MVVKEIPIEQIEDSQFNTRKDLADGQQDSTIEDLARSIERQGLLSPITVFQKPGGCFSLIAGQRRLLACKQLGRTTIPAIVRDSVSEADATAISLVENVHRADMNPRDKAKAFGALVDKFGDEPSVSRETGVGVKTIRKYVQLLDLAPELQERLAAGEAKNTEALACLAQKFEEADRQVEVWDRIGGFTQPVQQEIIKRVDAGLTNLDDVVAQAAEGAFDYHIVRNCPFDCPSVPEPLKAEVARIISEFKTRSTTGVKEDVRKRLRRGGVG
jgi:ParB family chromosome partitioning protein